MVDPYVHPIGTRVSKWGEGPVWWDGNLLYVDIEGKSIIRLNVEDGTETVWQLDERIGCVAPCQSGGLIYAGDNGIVRCDPETSERTVLADPEADKRGDNRFNDGKCSPAGNFWAGTISMKKTEGDAALYMLDASTGKLNRVIEGLTNSNGLCWSPDRSTFYHIDTPKKRVMAYDFDIEHRSISNERIAVDTALVGYASSPDGMTIDSNGHLWIAFCHGGCVVCFDPLTQNPIRRVDFPCSETTSCTFGGPNLERLFVTTGQRAGWDEPDAGRVFAVDGLGVTGLPASAYAG